MIYIIAGVSTAIYVGDLGSESRLAIVGSSPPFHSPAVTWQHFSGTVAFSHFLQTLSIIILSRCLPGRMVRRRPQTRWLAFRKFRWRTPWELGCWAQWRRQFCEFFLRRYSLRITYFSVPFPSLNGLLVLTKCTSISTNTPAIRDS